MSLLEAAGLGRAIDVPGAERRWLFRGLSFALGPGETLALQGPVGCGKSLLLRGLAWLDDLDEGTVRLEGRDPPGWGVPAWRSRVVYLHQSPAVGPGTVEDHLREPFGFAVHRTRPFDRERAAAALDAFGRRPGFLDREALELSGGERQVLAVVRAILLEPLVLLLDEPTSALDPASSSRFEARLGEWAAGRPDRGVVWVTHDRSQADRVAGRILDLVP